MSSSLSHFMHKLENIGSRNPLECIICDREFSTPVRLTCEHCFCKNCIENKTACPVCGKAVEGPFFPDKLLTYLSDISHEIADTCANCDQVSHTYMFLYFLLMRFILRQSMNEHFAKMFASHRIVPLEERAKVKGQVVCPLHNEPYILYSMESKTLACIICFNNASIDSRQHLVSIDMAHKIDCEKLELATLKLRNFQEEVYEQIELRKKLVKELDESHCNICSNIRTVCQEMIDAITAVKDKLLKKLGEEKFIRQSHFLEQINQLISLQPSIKLCLLAASMFCSSASKLDLLFSSSDLLKRIQNILSTVCNKPEYTGQLIENSKEELCAALEPFFGLSTVLLGSKASCAVDTNISGYSSRLQTGYAKHLKSESVSTKYQLVVDLAGAFGEEFAKIEVPLKQFNLDMALLGKRVQETQRDLTLRKCIIEKAEVASLTSQCINLHSKLEQQSRFIAELQPKLHQLWQEQVHRVRRQQFLFREKAEETIGLLESARHVANAARQLEPFAACIATVTSLIDKRRCIRSELAPMESICLQINTIEPNSQHRIEAIQKEENNRRMALDQKKREEQMQFIEMKKNLKTTKEQRKHKKDFFKDGVARPRLLTMNRDRSPGGTDRTLLSPHRQRPKCGSSTGSRSQSDVEEIESSMDDSFEFVAEASSAEAGTVKHYYCKLDGLHLSTPVSVPNSSRKSETVFSISLPDADQLSAGTFCGDNLSVGNLSSNRCNIIKSVQSNSSKIPIAPLVPKAIFTAITGTSTTGTYESRERVLASLMEKVTRVEDDSNSKNAEN
uniref:RING-type domain-containing protein n=1 Tax=Syphacia muris TaxID=451379 RepID=A0A0N5AG06_9BILA